MHGHAVPQTVEELKARCRIHASGCWELLKRNGEPYGAKTRCPQIGRAPNQKTVMAFALMIAGAPVKPGEVALHSRGCTFQWCCNPTHLRSGPKTGEHHRMHPNSLAPGRVKKPGVEETPQARENRRQGALKRWRGQKGVETRKKIRAGTEERKAQERREEVYNNPHRRWYRGEPS